MQLVVQLLVYAAQLLVAIPMRFAVTPIPYEAILALLLILVVAQPLEAAQATTLFAHALSAQVAQALVATQLGLAVALAYAPIVAARVLQPVATQAALQAQPVLIAVVASVVEAALVVAVVVLVAAAPAVAEVAVAHARDNE